ncbi:uncharacterized protein [Asterias amurensis]|uniref:uncharacterized protein n=1 Tax=Asterias amurensis TaxID=7602 RepID=UPI003AB77E02
MGNCFSRSAHRSRRGDSPTVFTAGADLAEEGNTDNQRPEMATNHLENNGDGRKVFLHNPEDTETYGVHFEVNLHQEDGRFVFKDFLEGGLAYKTGFRSGDVLVSANSIDIDNVDLMQLLKELHDYEEFKHIIGVERKLDDGKTTFIWVIFKITTKDGVLDVAVLETLENDRNEMPAVMLFPSTTLYDFIRVSTEPYNIYIEEDQAPVKYLTITGNKQLVFQEYNDSSKFFQYTYADPSKHPTEGAVVAYSLYDSFKECVKSSPATAKSSKLDTTVMNFPEYMTKDNIPPNPRFWYAFIYGGGISLQSMIAPGMYLGIGPGDKAILKTTKTSLRITKDFGETHP